MKPKSEKFTASIYVRMTPEMKKRVKAAAEKKKVEITAFCRGAILNATGRALPDA